MPTPTAEDMTSTIEACEVPSGYTVDATDCNDANANIYPGAAEQCDGEDTDCDPSTGEDGRPSPTPRAPFPTSPP